jgi:hypothetical protein
MLLPRVGVGAKAGKGANRTIGGTPAAATVSATDERRRSAPPAGLSGAVGSCRRSRSSDHFDVRHMMALDGVATENATPSQGRRLKQALHATSPTTPCPQRVGRSPAFQQADLWRRTLRRRSRRMASHGTGSRSWSMAGFLRRASFVAGPISASPLSTRGKSRTLELGLSGSVPGASRISQRNVRVQSCIRL